MLHLVLLYLIQYTQLSSRAPDSWSKAKFEPCVRPRVVSLSKALYSDLLRLTQVYKWISAYAGKVTGLLCRRTTWFVNKFIWTGSRISWMNYAFQAQNKITHVKTFRLPCRRLHQLLWWYSHCISSGGVLFSSPGCTVRSSWSYMWLRE